MDAVVGVVTGDFVGDTEADALTQPHPDDAGTRPQVQQHPPQPGTRGWFTVSGDVAQEKVVCESHVVADTKCRYASKSGDDCEDDDDNADNGADDAEDFANAKMQTPPIISTASNVGNRCMRSFQALES